MSVPMAILLIGWITAAACLLKRCPSLSQRHERLATFWFASLIALFWLSIAAGIFEKWRAPQ